MKKEIRPARRGDLVAVEVAELVHRGDETEMGRCYWTLGRVTLVNDSGTVMAYRRFGTHFVDRGVPLLCFGVGAHRLDMRAIESDMIARVAKDAKANELADLDAVNTYVLGFMKEVMTQGN
jgi:hypothetical protein